MNERDRDRSNGRDEAQGAVVDLVRRHYAPPRLEPARRVALEEELWNRIERSKRRRFLFPGLAIAVTAAAVAALVVRTAPDGDRMVAGGSPVEVASAPSTPGGEPHGGSAVAASGSPEEGDASGSAVVAEAAGADDARGGADALPADVRKTGGDDDAANAIVAAASAPKSELILARERGARIAALANPRDRGLGALVDRRTIGGLEYAMLAAAPEGGADDAEPARELPDDYEAIADVFLDF